MVKLSKKSVFRLVLILIPFIIFLILELTLRAFGYADDLKFVSEIERNGKEYYTINQLVGKRYFNKDRMYYRKGSHDYFEVNKSPQTIRIFCLGASTMAGFPYEYNALPSEFLRDRLTTAFPGRNIEVINTAIAATNSFTVDEFASELVKYKPDLFIVYMGQNEFYGVYGVGSTISVGKNRALIKTYLWLGHFKTFILLKDIINSLSGMFGPDDTQENKVLMEEMAKTSIRYNSDDYKTAVNTFRENYEEVIDIARENNIPIVISSLVRNEKSLHPFVSFHSESIDDSLESQSQKFYSLGLERIKNQDYETAAGYLVKSLAIDSTPADIHFSLGKCYEELGRYDEAEKQYSLAADLDGLRFRAPSDFNKIVFSLSRQYNVPFADVKNEFQENSADGIVGSELLVDHVHPNIKGYFLLAKTWFETLKKNDLLGLSPAVIESDSLIRQEAAVTQLDSLIGALKIMELKSRPPFADTDSDLSFVPKNDMQQFAYQYTVEHELSWAEAHLNTAKYYLSVGDFKKSLNELRAILVSDEDNPMVLKLAGDMSMQLNFYKQAEGYYLRANKMNANQFIEYKLGKAELKLGNPGLAISFFNSAIERNQQGSDKFNPLEIRDIYNNLAEAYRINNEPAKADDIMKQLNQ